MVRFPFSRRSRRARDQRGAVAVEFALIMPILCLLVFGIIEFGFMLNRDMIVGNASRDGARAASLGDTNDEICRGVKAELRRRASRCPMPQVRPTLCGPGQQPDHDHDQLQEAGRDGVLDRLRHRRGLGLHRDHQRQYNHTLITPFISSLLGNVVPWHRARR